MAGELKALPDGCDVNYWKTGKSPPHLWMEKAEKEVARAGGQVMTHAFGTDHALGRAAYMFEFAAGGERFRLVWPVLPHEEKDETAARRQAATMLFYDVKARCISARVLGFRRAFFAYMMLPDGKPAADHAAEPLIEVMAARKELNPGRDA